MKMLQHRSSGGLKTGQASAALANELVETYGHLVKKAVRMLFPRGNAGFSVIDLDDLEQAGYLGLIEASERFDETKGVKFETYALNRIRGSIQDELRKVDWVPRSVRKKVRETGKTMERYQQQSNERQHPQNVNSGSMGASLFPPVTQMQATDFSEEATAAVSTPMSTTENTPHERLELQEVREELIREIERLEKRDRLIIALHYFESLTFREIATILRISESRVSQLHGAILERLRERILAHA